MMEAHTSYAKHSLDLDKMLGEKKVELNEWECQAVTPTFYKNKILST
jgi:hypothetical protein